MLAIPAQDLDDMGGSNGFFAPIYMEESWNLRSCHEFQVPYPKRLKLGTWDYREVVF